MKRRHTVAVGIVAALMSSVALSAHAHPGGMGGMGGMQGGMMAQMGQGPHSASAQQGGGGAGHPGMGAGHQGMGGPGRGMAAQRGQAGEGGMAGGCPMMSQNSTHPSPTR